MKPPDEAVPEWARQLERVGDAWRRSPPGNERLRSVISWSVRMRSTTGSVAQPRHLMATERRSRGSR